MIKMLLTIALIVFTFKTYNHALDCNRFKAKKKFRVERNISIGAVVISLLLLSTVFSNELSIIIGKITMWF